MADTRTSQGPRRRSITREQLMNSAEASFLSRGYHGSTVEWLAAEAGYTTGAVYSSHGGKAGLFLAVLERRSDRQIEDWRAAAASADPEKEVSRLLRNQLEDPKALAWTSTYLEFFALAVRDPKLRKALAALLDRSLEGLAEALEPLSRNSSVPPLEFAELVRSASNGLAISATVHDRTDLFDLMSTLVSRLRGDA